MMKEEKQKTVEKQQTERQKNKAEIFIVLLCWILMMSIPAFLLVTVLSEGTIYRSFPYYRELLYVILIGCIPLFFILYIVAKIRKSPRVRPRYYLILLILTVMFFIEISLAGYIMAYTCCGDETEPSAYQSSSIEEVKRKVKGLKYDERKE